MMSPTTQAMTELARLAGEGKLVVDVDGGRAGGWDRSAIEKAYERMMGHKAQGKIVIEVPQ